jgi:glutaredoxin
MPLVVYTAAWCRDCRAAKRFLQEHQVPYTEIDIEETPGAADEVIENVGKRAVPQFVIDDERAITGRGASEVIAITRGVPPCLRQDGEPSFVARLKRRW